MEIEIWERMGQMNGEYTCIVLTEKQAIVDRYPNGRLHQAIFKRGSHGYNVARNWVDADTTPKPGFKRLEE